MNLLKREILNPLFAAFSLYTTMPVPQRDFSNECLKQALSFFPLTGLYCGLFYLPAYWLMSRIGLTGLFSAVLALALAAVANGAIHLDGFSDASDALWSRRSPEEQLRIMHDPHSGTMAVVSLIFLILAEVSLLSRFMTSIDQETSALIPLSLLGWIFLLAMERCFSALSLLLLPSAQSQGLGKTLREASEKSVQRNLVIEAAIFALLSILCLGLPAFVAIVATLIYYLLFLRAMKKRFGGMSGDLAGFWMCSAELLLLFMIVLGRALS